MPSLFINKCAFRAPLFAVYNILTFKAQLTLQIVN